MVGPPQVTQRSTRKMIAQIAKKKQMGQVVKKYIVFFTVSTKYYSHVSDSVRNVRSRLGGM